VLVTQGKPDSRQGRKGKSWAKLLGLVSLLVVTSCATYTEQRKDNLHFAEYQTVSVHFQDVTAEPYGRSVITPGELVAFQQTTVEKLTDLSLFQAVEPVPDTSDLHIVCQIEDFTTSYRNFRFWTNLGPGKGAITFTTHFIDMHTGEEVARFRKKTKVPDFYRTVEGLVKVMRQAVADDITAFVAQYE
jgi:hypothetical protein